MDLQNNINVLNVVLDKEITELIFTYVIFVIYTMQNMKVRTYSDFCQ